MLPLYIDERMEEMDKNKDGEVTLEEYIGKSSDDIIDLLSSHVLMIWHVKGTSGIPVKERNLAGWRQREVTSASTETGTKMVTLTRRRSLTWYSPQAMTPPSLKHGTSFMKQILTRWDHTPYQTKNGANTGSTCWLIGVTFHCLTVRAVSFFWACLLNFGH